MTLIAAGPIDGVGLAAARALFRGLADETRLRILVRLAASEARVVDLCEELRMGQSTVSAHLACLRDCGLVDSRPLGRASMYRLCRPELADLLAAADRLLAGAGQRTGLCSVYSEGDTGLGESESAGAER